MKNKNISIFLILIIMIFVFTDNIIAKETIKKFEDYNIASGDTIVANITVFRGDADISGVLDGDLSVYSGNVRIKKDGIITGSVQCYAGKVYRDKVVDDECSYYVMKELKNYVFSGEFLSNDFESVSDKKKKNRKSWRNDEDDDDSFDIDLNVDLDFSDEFKKKVFIKKFYYHNTALRRNFIGYSKVEGLFLGLNTDLSIIGDKKEENDFKLDVFASFGYGFRSKKIDYYIEEKMTFWQDYLSIGAYQHYGVATDDQWKISNKLNTLSAMFIHEDFYQYYLSAGNGFFAGSVFDFGKKTSEDFYGLTAFKVAFNQDKITSINNKTNYSLFGGEKDFNRNIDASEGRLKEMLYKTVIELGYNFSSDNKIVTALSLEYETTLNKLGQDFTFEKGIFNHYLGYSFEDLAITNSVRFESVTTEAPNFKYMSIGGTGTLPGHKFNAYSGNKGFVDRFMFEILKGDFVDYKFIFDFGNVWFSNTNDLFAGFKKELRIDNIESSFGVGLGLFDNYIFSIHKRLDTDKDPYQFQLSANFKLK